MHRGVQLVRRRTTGSAAAAAAVVAIIGLTFAASPAMAADGSGSMTVSPTYVISGSSGNFLTFTYTAGAGGVTNGEIAVLVPTGWTTPDSNGFNAGGTNASCTGNAITVSPVMGGNQIQVTGVTLNAGDQCTIRYGLSGFNAGDTAPSSAGTNTFTTQEKSTSGGTLTNLSGGSPQVVVGNDGTGTMTVSPTRAVVNSSGNTLTFTYTAARTISSGQVTIAVPAGWSTPSTSAAAAGATTSTCGTVGVSSSTIQITGMNMSSGASCTVTYGNKSGGPGATAPSTGGVTPFTFTTQQESTNDSNLVALPTSPQVIVTAADGTGTIGESPSSFITSSTGNELDFTYTAPAGGLNNGKLTILVPTGWTTPDSNGFNAGGVSNGCSGDPVTIGTVGGGHLIQITSVTMNSGSTCVVKYGINGFNAGVTAPSTQGAYVFTTQEASTATGTLTNVGASPTVQVGDDGTGTMTVSPTRAVVNSSGNTLTFTYTAARTISSGQVTIAVPAGWSTPSTSAAAAGATTSTCGTVGVSSSTIQITGMNMSSGASCTVTYGNKSGGPGATAPSTGGVTPFTFTTQEKSSGGGTLTTLGAGSPQVIVTALDGTGTMGESPTPVITSSTGNELDFTYTAPAGGLNNGKLTILVPTGWTTPDSNGFNAGGVSNGCSGDPVTIGTVGGGHLIQITSVTMNSGSTCVVKYGIDGFNAGVTAPSSGGVYTFTTQEASTATGTLTNLATSPAVTVGSDGTGTMTVSPTHAVVNSTGNTLIFTYTAATTISSGQVTIAVPAGWSTPSTSAAAAGATTSTCGTVGVSSSTIQVTGVNLSASGTCTVTYGSKSGGPGATAPSTGGAVTFTTQEKSSSGGALANLGAGSPSVTVVAQDGTGTMSVSPATVLNGSSGNQLVFTYTAPTGGLDNGEITVLVPSGWTTPQTGTPSGAGWVISGCGSTTSVSSMTIQVTGVSLSAGGICTITYGDTFNGGSGATAPLSSGGYTFVTKEMSTASGLLSTLATSPAVNVNSDGTGTMTVSPPSVSAGATGNTVTFTYTSAAALSSGELSVALPAGWSAPSTTGAAPGYTTTTCAGGTVGVSGSTIQVTGITIGSGASCSITYGATSSGGPGATATSTVGSCSFSTQEKSSSGGTLAALATSPHLTVFAPDGSGTLAVSPTFTASGSGGNTLTFTFTAATGGLSSGQIRVAVPAGWSAPSTTGGVAGYTTSTCGSVSISSGTIEIGGVSLPAAGTCTITYGATSSGGTGATAPSSSGDSTFATQEQSTGASTPTSITSSPKVDVTSADGGGTMTVAPAAVSTGSSGNTLTFTFTAAGGGTHGGEIAVNVPAGWSAPSTAPSAAGYTTTNCGTAGISASTIQITAVTLPGGGTCTVVYGSRASGGPGASASSSDATRKFTTSEMSTASGTLTPISASPSVTTSPARTLTVVVTGSGTVSGGGISCPGTCSNSYAAGTVVSLSAAPAAGFSLSSWGGACSGTGACSVTMSDSQSVSATFTRSGSSSVITKIPSGCSLKVFSSKVHKPKTRHGVSTVSVAAKCDQAVSVTLTGALTEKLAKHRTKVLALGHVNASLVAGVAKTLVLKIPASALKALAHGTKESATFTLTATNANGTVRSTAAIQKLKQ